MRRKEEEYLSGNLTAMIDVVFQLIIFFVCTASMQSEAMDVRFKLAQAKDGIAITGKDPREIIVDIDSEGKLSIARTLITKPLLHTVMKKAIAEYGNDIPVIIRGDKRATHTMIRQAMDTCSAAGIWKIKIAALKEVGDKK